MAKDNKTKVVVSVDLATMVKAVLLVVALLASLAFLNAISQALVILLSAFFLALALNPIVSWIARNLKSQSRVRATGAAYVLVLSVLIAFFVLVVPPLVSQTVNFIRDVPNTIENFKRQDNAVNSFIYQYNLDEQLNQIKDEYSTEFSDFSKPALSAAGTIGSVLVTIIAILVLTFMMLIEGPKWFDKVVKAQPAAKREKRRRVAYRMYKVVTSYVNGQVLIAVISGIFAFFALLIASDIFNASINAVALAGIITVFALLPLIGTTIGASIVVIACLFVSLPLAITIAIFFVVYQQIENATLQPYIQSRANQLTPLIVFSAALIGASFQGLMGAIVAIPIAGCIKVLVDEYYGKDKEPAAKKVKA